MRKSVSGLVPGLVVLVLAVQPVQRAYADDQPTDPASAVLVTMQMPKRGVLEHLIEAYGTAVPEANAILTLSQPQDGVVADVVATAGQMLRKGDVIMHWAPSAAANAQYDQARNALTLAIGQRNSTERLLKQNLATRDQLASANKTVLDAQSSLTALHRNGGDVRMPVDGIVLTIPVASGDRTQPGAPLATLQPKGALVVTAGVELADAGLVRPGQTALLQPLAGTVAAEGRLLRVDAVINPRTRLIDTDISTPDGSLVSGGDYRALIDVGPLSGWLVPHEAVLTDDQGAYLFQIIGEKPLQKSKRVPARVLGTQGDIDVVTAAIDPALGLVVTGGHQLSDGAPVRFAGAAP